MPELRKTGSRGATSVEILIIKLKRVYYKRVVYDGVEFAAGDDVYVKRREDASSDDEEPEEECRVGFKPAGRWIMIECDDCLNGFHLKCLKPPLRKVPEPPFEATWKGIGFVIIVRQAAELADYRSKRSPLSSSDAAA